MKILKADLLKALDYPHLVFHQFVSSNRTISKLKVSKVPDLKMSPEAKLLSMRLGADNITVGDLYFLCMDYVEAAAFEQVKHIDDKGCRVPPKNPRDYLIKNGKWLDLLSCLAMEYYLKDEKDIVKKLKQDIIQKFPKTFEIKLRT